MKVMKSPTTMEEREESRMIYRTITPKFYVDALKGSLRNIISSEIRDKNQ